MLSKSAGSSPMAARRRRCSGRVRPRDGPGVIAQSRSVVQRLRATGHGLREQRKQLGRPLVEEPWEAWSAPVSTTAGCLRSPFMTTGGHSVILLKDSASSAPTPDPSPGGRGENLLCPYLLPLSEEGARRAEGEQTQRPAVTQESPPVTRKACDSRWGGTLRPPPAGMIHGFQSRSP